MPATSPLGSFCAAAGTAATKSSIPAMIKVRISPPYRPWIVLLGTIIWGYPVDFKCIWRYVSYRVPKRSVCRVFKWVQGRDGGPLNWKVHDKLKRKLDGAPAAVRRQAFSSS